MEEWKEKTVSNYSLIAHEDRRCIGFSHSISRNIAEGYSRRSIKEYLNFLNISLGSSGEYHSCIISVCL